MYFSFLIVEDLWQNRWLKNLMQQKVYRYNRGRGRFFTSTNLNMKKSREFNLSCIYIYLNRNFLETISKPPRNRCKVYGSYFRQYPLTIEYNVDRYFSYPDIIVRKEGSSSPLWLWIEWINRWNQKITQLIVQTKNKKWEDESRIGSQTLCG